MKKKSNDSQSSPVASDLSPINELEKLRIELHNTKEVLRASQNEYQQLLNYESHGVRIVNKDFSVRLVNRTFARMSGIQAEKCVGKTCYELFPGPYCHTTSCRLVRILSGEEFIQAEIDRVIPSGQVIPCIVNAVPTCNEKGEVDGVIETFTDISEKRQLEGQVKESEDRYRALIELGTEIGEAIVMLQDIDGKEGIQTFVSDQWAKISGYDKEELLGNCFFDLIGEPYRRDSIERHRQKMTGISVPGLYELSILRKDGTQLYIELTGASTIYMGKRANIVYIRDISQRKKAEKEILEAQARISQSEERYHSLFENVPVAIWELDYTDVKLYIDDLRARGVIDFDGYFNNNPKDFRYCFNLRKVIGLNNAVVSLAEADSKEQVLTKIQAQLEKRPARLTNDMKNLVALTQGKTKITYQTYEPSFKGTWNYLNVEFMLAPGCENTWSRVYLTAFDITERVQAENVLKEYQEQLEEKVTERTQQLLAEIEQRREAEKKLSDLYALETKIRCELENQISRRIEFTRMLVHELKTPLSPMLGSSEILLQSLEDNNLMRIAMNIHRGALDLSNRIADLIDLNQGEMGIINLVPEIVNPATILKEIGDYVRPMAERKGQQLSIELEDSLPAAWIDTARLRQITLNLLENASRYTPKGGMVTLKATASNTHLLIQVIDTGCGISKRDQKRLFDPYPMKRAKDNRNNLGIGLPLCKMLVELHGGAIWVNSQKNKGSTFTFTIPLDSSVPRKRRYSK